MFTNAGRPSNRHVMIRLRFSLFHNVHHDQLFFLLFRYGPRRCWTAQNRMVFRKDEIEASLAEENKLIENGTLKEDSPLDDSKHFLMLCEACRRGDLKVCQEMITEGANINAKDKYDYTPLILVRAIPVATELSANASRQGQLMRPIRSGTATTGVRRALRTRYIPGRAVPI